MRPALALEFRHIEGFFHCVSIPTPSRITLQYPRDSLRNFDYSYIFDEKTTQKEVFQVSAQPLIDHILEGYNATYFVYGQTGTGKTHTMGMLDKISDSSSGIVPNSIRMLFQELKSRE